ncbi:MAG: mechanosensitive ion channel family protein [Kiritimatiellaceae bacterium]|nr:mechanosensitive ion channel family protein [Kiritimatiellaceae bacterium]
MNHSHRLLMEAHQENQYAPGLFTKKDSRYKAQRAEILFKRAVYCLNLSECPPALRTDIGYEGALALKEIFDRIEIPSAKSIPDLDDVRKDQMEHQIPWLERWNIPQTQIVIARVESGPRTGEYLVTPETVRQLSRFYKMVKPLPYKMSDKTTPGFLEFYLKTPGRLLPPKWSRLLPAWSTRVYYSQAIWQWSALIFLITLTILLLREVRRLLRIHLLVAHSSQRLWRLVFFRGVIIVVTFLLFGMLKQVNLSGAVQYGLQIIFSGLWWFVFAITAHAICMSIAATIIDSPKIDPEGIQASYVRALFGLIGLILAAVLLLIGLSRTGVSLGPLLAGVGIGGIAFALAARPSLENLIASFTLLIDKPFQVGERVNIMGHNGVIESIGLRSTCLRLLTGHFTNIPNEKIAAADIENIGRRPHIRRRFNINITYGTPPDKISRALEILQEILAVPEEKNSDTPHPNEGINKPDFPPRIYFNELNSDSLNILVIYWFHPPRYWEFLEHSQMVNLQIMTRFNAEGIKFAFPTQTLHLVEEDKQDKDDSGSSPLSMS